MSIPPIPVVFKPIFKPKPWGGRRLAELFNKPLPTGERIGESWELASLPPPAAADTGYESTVCSGPLAGRTVTDLMALWGKGLYGGAELADGRFPLLIKFLDARENLSVQVHPKPGAPPRSEATGPPPVKHEAWYVVDAEPGAELYIGVRPGVGPQDVAAAANTPAMAGLLRRWPAKPGRCYYLPSGTLHALGAGIVVAEVQTPSDVTYRIYDWDRLDAAGRPRELHIERALENIDFADHDDLILQPRRHVAGVFFTATRLTVTERFTIEKIRVTEGAIDDVARGEMAVWIVLRGAGAVRTQSHECTYIAGDVLLLPAAIRSAQLQTRAYTELLEVKIPIASSLRGVERPEPEPPPQRNGVVPMTISGRPPTPQ